MTSEDKAHLNIKFSLKNEEKRIVYGVVYAPHMLDSYMGFADGEVVEKLAYEFLKLDLSSVIDTRHDNIPNGSYPVESFIAREGDKDFPEGSWVLGVKVEDDLLWKQISNGELNGFSMEVLVRRRPHLVKMSTSPIVVGETKESADHTHTFYIEFNENGDIIGGKTSIDNDHYHTISKFSVTNMSSDGHNHRIVITNK